MKPSEMSRYTFVSSMDLSILVEKPNGDWVRHSDAMQVIQALEAKIKGMIERPMVEVRETDGRYWVVINNNSVVFQTKYNQIALDLAFELDQTFALASMVATHALGMEGGADE